MGVLNASNITSTTEVVVAPPSVYLHGVSQKLRGDVKVRTLHPSGVVFARCCVHVRRKALFYPLLFTAVTMQNICTCGFWVKRS